MISHRSHLQVRYGVEIRIESEVCFFLMSCEPVRMCQCDVCHGSQDDGRKTVSEQGVPRITSKETAQTEAQEPLRQTNTDTHENLTKEHRVRKTSARRNARQVPKIHKTKTTKMCAQLLTECSGQICYAACHLCTMIPSCAGVGAARSNW